MTQRVDRRIQRTRQLLHKALIELIMEKPYDQITVQDILDRANIGRATFYAHFSDKDALLLGGMDEDHFDIRLYLDEAEIVVDEDKLLPCYSLFRHAQQFHPLYKAMLGGNGIEVVKKAFHKHLVHAIEQRIKRYAPTISLPLPLVSHYLAGALMSLIIWWLDHEMPHSPEEMDTMVQQIAMMGLERLSHE